jgi:hypothetical protein
MDPQTYIECDTNLQTAAFEEWLGREYGRDYQTANNLTVEYPIPPDNHTGPPPTEPNSNPPPEAWTYYYVRAKMKAIAGTGGVVPLDDEIVRFATQTQTLSNGNTYFLDISANAKTFEQLSAAGQVAVTPPEIP